MVKSVFDADRHVIEPNSFWQQYTDQNIFRTYPIIYRNEGELLKDRYDHPVIYLNNSPLLNHWGEKLQAASSIKSREIHDLLVTGIDSKLQLQSMDNTNIGQAAIFSTFAQYVINHACIPTHASLEYADAFNRWLDTFCQEDSSRLFGAALISRHDPQTMLAQLERILSYGFTIIHLRPEVIAGYSLGDKAFNDFWQACEANSITIAFHGGTHLQAPTVGTDRYTSRFGLHACSHPMEAQMAFLSLLESGVLERHPKLRFVFLEAGASWLPHWLWRLDNICYPEFPMLIKDNIKMLPSEYFKRQCWVAIELGEPCLREVINCVGHERLLYGTDFPHPDHLQFTTDNITDQLSELSEEELMAVLQNNAEECFGLPDKKQEIPEEFNANSPHQIYTNKIVEIEAEPQSSSVKLTKNKQQDEVINNLPGLDAALNWHPRFNVYQLDNQDILITNEDSQLLLKNTIFPHFEMIDGILTTNDILTTKNLTHNPTVGATFIYQLNQLIKQELIVDSVHNESSDNFNQYVKNSFDKQIKIKETHEFNKSYQIINLSYLSEKQLLPFYQLINEVYQETYSDLSVSFLLVDDFLDPRIIEVNIDTNWLVVKATGNKIWLSACYHPTDKGSFALLQRRVLDNQPARKAMVQFFPKRNHSYPFKKITKLSKTQQQSLKKLLNHQLTAFKSNKPSELALYDITTSQTEFHPSPSIEAKQTSIVEQIQSPIKLEICEANFEQDGGSRSISTTETISRLQKIISPITGLITHIEDISPTDQQPIKIYRTGFFKTPSINKPMMLEQNSFVQICLGKGVSQEQSKASGLCEAVERYTALYQGDEPKKLAKPSELDNRYYCFQQLVPYSQQQYTQFADSKHPDSTLKQAATPYSGEAINWIPTWSLNHQASVYVPFTCCFSETSLSDEQYGRWNSNGCAAGNTLEEAILQGLYELIERDATAIWWYNRIPRPVFDIKTLNPNHLQLLKTTLEPTHNYWVINITTDVRVPVMAAIAQDKHTGGYSLGFGQCH